MSRIAILGMGNMGASIATRMVRAGVDVITLTQGRSAASQERARAAGVRAVQPHEFAQASHVLSIVPPMQAQRVAIEFCGWVSAMQDKPAFLDCNAINVETSAAIGRCVQDSGCRYVDACIIGSPGSLDQPGPVIYLSGEIAQDAALLNSQGVRARSTGAPAGAASALKMAYAGFNKGLTGLAAAMVLAAAEAGATDALRAELADSAPHLLDHIASTLPDMYAKAWRWEFEMREVAGFGGRQPHIAELFNAMADFYAALGRDWSTDRRASQCIEGFLRGERIHEHFEGS